MLGSLKMTLFLPMLLALTIMGSALSLSTQEGQSQPTPNQHLIEQQQKKQAELEEQFPVVDYDAPEVTNDPEKLARRKEKNRHFDKRSLVYQDPTPRISEVARIIEGYDVPALPIAQSSLIIMGEILDSRAHLSNDKRGVYTELIVRIGEVIKNTTPVQPTQGVEITATREGGIVRYANGHKRLYHLAEEGMPAVGRRYVLFLSSVENSDDYSILTGYELTETRVVPVDSSHQFATYNGYAIDAFLGVIRASLNQPQYATAYRKRCAQVNSCPRQLRR